MLNLQITGKKTISSGPSSQNFLLFHIVMEALNLLPLFILLFKNVCREKRPLVTDDIKNASQTYKTIYNLINAV